MEQVSNGAFYAVAEEADRLIKAGATVFFKWTCDACGQRVMFGKKNTLYMRGEHSDCPVQPGFTTDLVERGCNFMLISGNRVDEFDWEDILEQEEA